MNKGEFIDRLAERTGFIAKDSKIALKTVMEIITETVAGNGKLLLTRVWKIEPRPRKESRRINPQTGERITVPSKVVPAFKAGKNLREEVLNDLKAVESGSGDLEVEKA